MTSYPEVAAGIESVTTDVCARPWPRLCEAQQQQDYQREAGLENAAHQTTFVRPALSMPWSWSQSVPCGIPGGFTAAGQGTDQAVMSMGETVDLRKSLGDT